MIGFILGSMFGGTVGVVAMCRVLQQKRQTVRWDAQISRTKFSGFDDNNSGINVVCL